MVADPELNSLGLLKARRSRRSRARGQTDRREGRLDGPTGTVGRLEVRSSSKQAGGVVGQFLPSNSNRQGLFPFFLYNYTTEAGRDGVFGVDP